MCIRDRNRAYKGSKRQPGSTFKILAAYAPALDSCGKTLATIVRDDSYKYKNGKEIRNANGRHLGDITYRTAIAQSVNVAAVKVSDEITQELGFEYCEDFGITTLHKDSDIVQALSLGGITDGVYNYQMCAAYATIANGGVYNSPTMYTCLLYTSSPGLSSTSSASAKGSCAIWAPPTAATPGWNSPSLPGDSSATGASF